MGFGKLLLLVMFVLVTVSNSSVSFASGKRIVVSIDGTSNDPNDAEENYRDTGLLEDKSISNVLKLHILAGGDLNNTQNDADQHALYYVGVGNRGATKVYRTASAMFAITEPRQILDKAYQDIVDIYTENDSIYIFGFSRGAAIARWLAQRIHDQGLVKKDEKGEITEQRRDIEIEFLGVWDTVAALGGVSLDTEEQPESEALTERGKIAPNIKQAYHLVSIDDPRLAFRPTLMGAEERVQEIWFAGVHSDVGGGYHNDGLSDVTLKFMQEKARAAGVSFKNLEEIDFDAVAPVEKTDITIVPNIESSVHLNTVIDDKAYYAWLDSWKVKKIFAMREIYVSVDDARTDHPPLIHHSVIARKNAMSGEYNPPNLNALTEFNILNADGSISASP